MKVMASKAKTNRLRLEKNKVPMIEERTWKEFRDAKMLWFVNMILHAFGWVIVTQYDDGVEKVFPARTKYRGFGTETNDEGYLGLSKYMAENAQELLKEAQGVNENHYTSKK